MPQSFSQIAIISGVAVRGIKRDNEFQFNKNRYPYKIRESYDNVQIDGAVYKISGTSTQYIHSGDHMDVFITLYLNWKRL